MRCEMWDRRFRISDCGFTIFKTLCSMPYALCLLKPETLRFGAWDVG